MQVASIHFKRKASENLGNEKLQSALMRLQERFVDARAAAITDLDDFEATRDAAQRIRDRVLNNLDGWLLHFEREAISRGG